MAAQVNFNILRSPHGIGQGLGDVLRLQVGIIAENLVPSASRGDQADHRANRYTHARDITAGSRVMRVSCGMLATPLDDSPIVSELYRLADLPIPIAFGSRAVSVEQTETPMNSPTLLQRLIQWDLPVG
jgi:hypothetical protein